MMITVCWTGSNVAGLVKVLKYMEQAAINMLALTNFAICINLALIILVSNEDSSSGGSEICTLDAYERETRELAQGKK